MKYFYGDENYTGDNNWSVAEVEPQEKNLNKTVTPVMSLTTRWEIIQNGSNKGGGGLSSWIHKASVTPKTIVSVPEPGAVVPTAVLRVVMPE